MLSGVGKIRHQRDSTQDSTDGGERVQNPEMNLPNRQRRLSSAVLVAVGATLVLLAVFQYVWSEQAMKATTGRMASLLRSSMLDWHMELFHQLSDICVALRINPDFSSPESRSVYAIRFEQWQQSAEYPTLAANLSIWELAENGGPRLLRLNPANRQFEPGEWSPRLEPLRKVLETKSGSFDLTLAASTEPEKSFGPTQDRSRPFRDQTGPGPFAGWLFDANVPALVHPIAREAPKGIPASQAGQKVADWIVVELNQNVLRSQVLPALTRRYFSGPRGLEYQVALVAGDNTHKTLFATSPDLAQRDENSADAVMDVLGSRHQREIVLGLQGKNLAAESNDDERHGEPGRGGPPPLWFPLISENGEEPDWDLIVWHRNGSLASQAFRLRWRNLGISFAAIALLALSTALLAFTTRRAQELADKEINFLAAVSHELRTPLAVISSAADNLADGVVQGPEQLARYGAIIQSQSRQLSDLIEQILLFAATRQGTAHHALTAIAVPEVIGLALRNTQEFIRKDGVTVEQFIASDLQPVLGDRTALSQVLQNLITNAVKYGGPAKWMGIRAMAAEGGAAKEVEISIEDHGAGISEDEMQRIFEPFYRSPSATEAQIHGTGLGLPLARSIAEAMGGRLTVRSTQGAGRTFLLSLPVAPASAESSAGAVSENKAT